MEQEAKTLLYKRLDDCLLEHAEAICGNGRPAIKDVYELQLLSEVHDYLKTGHEFTAAETEALLQFQDPLNVTRWCWEENTHKYSFPICELLQKIHADQKFSKVTDGAEEQKRKYKELMTRIGQDYYIYRDKLDDCTNSELIDRAEEIAVVQAAYRYLAEEGTLTEEETDLLLQFDRPLVEIVKYWPTADTKADLAMELFLHEMTPPVEEKSDLPKSVLERLKDAGRDVKEKAQSVQEKRKEAER